MRTILTATATALVLVLAACRSGVIYPERMYDDVVALSTSQKGTGGLRENVREKMDARYETVVRWHEEGRLVSAEDHFFAAITLTVSDHVDQLALAQELGIRSAELGDERGYLAYAHATDKLAFELGEHYQRYGTQIVFQPVLGRFELHPIDPRTTDEERAAMGVPPLAQLQAEVDELNASRETELLRERVQKPGR